MRKYLFAVLFGLFTCPLFATGIDANATSVDCDNATLGQYNGTANLEMDWQPNTINVRWYSDDTQLSVPTNAQTCSYDGDLYLPSAPTKKGYTFEGWELKHAIPEEYTELQYIESSGTQYIDTGFVSTGAAYKHSIVFEPLSSGTGYLCGSGTSGGRAGNVKFSNYAIIGIYIGTTASSVSSGSPALLKSKNTLVMNFRNKASNTILLNNVNIGNSSATTITSSGSLKLFSSGGSSSIPMRIYEDSIEQNGTLLRNFIPAKRNSDNVIGMWDTVTQTFFTNAGSGTFTAGPAAQ